MKITSIKITEKANLGNYESLEFSAEAVIEDGDGVQDVTTKLADYVNWNARKPERDAKARQFRAVVNDANAAPDAKTHAEKWLKKYDELKARAEAL